MAQSASKSGESKEGGLVMHTKMLRYERVISVSSNFRAGFQDKLTEQELNQKRLAKQPMELCQALEETVKGDQVSYFSHHHHLGEKLMTETTPPSYSLSHPRPSCTRAITSGRVKRTATRTCPREAIRPSISRRSEEQPGEDVTRAPDVRREAFPRARVSE